MSLQDIRKLKSITPEVHLAQYHLAQKKTLSAILFRAKFINPKAQLAQNAVLLTRFLTGVW